MKFRSIIFWSHLVTGVAAGLVILMMSVTGVLLTYERQMIASAEADLMTIDGPRLSLDALIEKAEAYTAGSGELQISADAQAPIRLFQGRAKHLMNPATGEITSPVETETEAFFDTVMRIHRWFNLTGESRATGKAITGAANLMFIFLALSGAYLWLPPAMRWAAFKTRLVFRRAYSNGHARDYNWHHVFSAWMLIPIFVMATTATVFSYRWAHELVYTAYGEEPPQRGRRSPPPALGEKSPSTLADAASLEARFSATTAELQEWQFITVPVRVNLDEDTVFEVDMGNGAQYHQKYDVTVATDGTISNTHQPFGDRSPASQARVTIRFLHTGEVLGFWGQTLAGIGSLAAIFLVWSGFALSYRRLIRPLFKKKS